MSGFETLLMAAGAVTSAVGTIASGAAANSQAQQEALNAEAEGKAELAAATRKAADERQKANLVLSRQQALAASSGGGASPSDAPTITKIMTDTAGQGALNSSMEIWGGQSRKEGLYSRAKALRAQGNASLLGGILGGFGQAASGFGKIDWGK